MYTLVPKYYFTVRMQRIEPLTVLGFCFVDFSIVSLSIAIFHSEPFVDCGIKPPFGRTFVCSRRITYSTKLLELPNHDTHIHFYSLVSIKGDELYLNCNKNVKQNWNSKI